MPDSPLSLAGDGSRRDPVFIEDGRPISAEDFMAARASLVQQLAARPLCRVAVHSTLPSPIAVALSAAAETGHELLIIRSEDNPRSVAAASSASIYIDTLLKLHELSAVPACRPEAGTVLIATSGTAGVPKLARHNLQALLSGIRAVHTPTGTARWLLTYQAGGFAGLQLLLTALLKPAVVVALSHGSVDELARAVIDHGVTHLSGTPTFWRSFLMCAGHYNDRTKLKQITLGGEIADQAILDHLRASYPEAAICHVYASTEAGVVFAVKEARAGFPSEWLVSGAGDCRLRIVDNALEVLSPRSMKAYADSTNSVYTEDGWVRTGDLVHIDGGRVYFAGRRDSTINVGGVKAVREVIEEVILGIPNVTDVRAFPVPNPFTGALVGVEVVAGPGADLQELRAIILQTGRSMLNTYSAPRVVRFVQQIRSDASRKKSRNT